MPRVKKLIKEKPLLPLKMFHITGEDSRVISSSHMHTAIELSCVIGGKGRMSTPTGGYDFERGTVFLFAPGQSHKAEEYSKDTDILVLHFEPHYIWDAESGFSGTQLLDTFLNPSPEFKSCLCAPDSEYVYNSVVAMEEELINLETEYNSALRIKLADILVYLLRSTDFASPAKMSVSRSYNLQRLRLAMEYIDSHINTDIDLDALASTAEMSRSYFCTVFRRYNGITPWDYITIRRIDKALRILAFSDEKKINIAFDCGFNNTANFYRAFKKVTGKIPGDYAQDGNNC